MPLGTSPVAWPEFPPKQASYFDATSPILSGLFLKKKHFLVKAYRLFFVVRRWGLGGTGLGVLSCPAACWRFVLRQAG